MTWTAGRAPAAFNGFTMNGADEGHLFVRESASGDLTRLTRPVARGRLPDLFPPGNVSPLGQTYP